MDPKSLQIRLRANHMMITNVGFLRTEDCRRLIDSKIVLYYINICIFFLNSRDVCITEEKRYAMFQKLKMTLLVDIQNT